MSDAAKILDSIEPPPTTRNADADRYAEPRRFVAQGLSKTKDGGVRTTIANLTHILTCDPEWQNVIAWDAFREDICTTKPAPCLAHEQPHLHAKGPWTDEHTTRLASWSERTYGANFSIPTVERAVLVVARKNEHHEVRDYLNVLEHDGIQRLDSFATRYLGAEDAPYTRRVSSITMISSVARIFRPGCKFDTVTVFEGPQGMLKSSVIDALFDEWYTDSHLDIGTKDAYQHLRGAWGVELAEVDKYRGKDASQLKSFISSATDRYRPSYARKVVDVPRQCVFIGTTNEHVYLGDWTGGRRWLPLKVGTVDLEAIRRDRDQLWAEAVARFRAGETWYADNNEFRDLAQREQEARTHEDPWLAPLENWLRNSVCPTSPTSATGSDIMRENFTTSDALDGAIQKPRGSITKADETRIGNLLRSFGYEPVRPCGGGSRTRRYRLAKVGPVGQSAGAAPEPAPKPPAKTDAPPVGPVGHAFQSPLEAMFAQASKAPRAT
jgi:putative DNA primase/helicase